MGGTRDTGVNGAANLLYLCYPCHREIEEYRAAAIDSGYLVSRLTLDDPADIPVFSRGRWKQFDHDGGFTVIENQNN
ncbi:HNH endonuclease [Gordonia phage Gsput1]|uniref:HNH endonuclease n=1 Tax=Gordonia phage Gsput1 TaxID=1622193 RepID=A0A0E3T700_9CAUD|nr:HNH endonuclease [Gordonia phage Gsput1]AKC03069.1 hypothetical protein Gsput1_44 [Gordonia phage Gsput1]